MPRRTFGENATEKELDGIARILDDANLIFHGFDGVITRWTAGCEKLYGWSRDEAVGRVVHQLLETEFPKPVAALREDVRAGNTWHGEVVHRHKQGHHVVVATRWVVVNKTSDRPVIIQTNNDVTNMKRFQDNLAEREAHLQSILATVPDAMIVIDDRGTITSFSSAAEKLFGYDAQDVFGKNVSMLMPSPDREAHDNYLAHYLATSERRIIGYGRVVTGLRKDATTFPMELSVGEAVSGDKRIFTGFIRDLTSRHRIEEELRQAQKMEAVGQLTGGLAHDFNNLLTIISGNLEMLEARLVDDHQQLLLREAQDAADDGARLTGQLLAFGRRQPLNPTTIDVGSLVSGFSDLLRRTLGETIQFRTILTGQTCLALVDGSQLQNALLNLCFNARDAMPKGGQLTIDISQSDLDHDYTKMYPSLRPGKYVLVSVTDTGTGMSQDVKERAFEPFFTTKAVGAGTGLGLSMVYGFAKQSGGHIQLYSEPTLGTSVRIFLPSAAQASQPEAASGRDHAIPRGSETILVVEDDARVRRVSVARLLDAGYAVLEAGNPREALDIVERRHDISLLFTDIVMPGGMTGDQLARQVRVLRPGIKILFTSGYAEPGIVGREFAEGSWLKKPYTALELATRLRQLLDDRVTGTST